MNTDLLVDPLLLDLKTTCRLCLQQATELISLFPHVEPSDNSVSSLPSKIMACLSIDVSIDCNMPRHVCQKCIQQIDNWVKFKDLCDSANLLLHRCLENFHNSSNEDCETLKNNCVLNGQNDTLSDMDVSIFERESLFGGLDEGHTQSDVLPISEDLLSFTEQMLNQKIKIINNPCTTTIVTTTTTSTTTTTTTSSSSSVAANNHNAVMYCTNPVSIMSNLSRVSINNISNTVNKSILPSSNTICSFQNISSLSKNNENNLTLVSFNENTDITDNGKCEEKAVSKWKKKYDEVYKKEYPCGICDKKFSKFTNLIRHDITIHKDMLDSSNNSTCDTCGKIFILKSRLDYHVLKHREKHFECPQCNKKMLSKKSLQVHLRLHNPNSKFKCEFCGVIRNSKGNLDDHIRCKHSDETPFSCNLCGKQFKTSQSKELHHKRRHMNIMIKCNICGRLCDHDSTCKQHMESHKNTKDLVCQHCGEFFKTYHSYYTHKRNHETLKNLENNENNVKLYKCLICSYKSQTRYLLQRHEATHLNLQPYKCHLCEKSYKRKDLLTNHIRVHTGEKRYSCVNCRSSFITLRHLNNHIKKCNNNGINNSNDQNNCDNNTKVTEDVHFNPHKCHVCEKSFTRKYLLTNHLRVHTGEQRTYSCINCSSTFFSSRSLKCHSIKCKNSSNSEKNQFSTVKDSSVVAHIKMKESKLFTSNLAENIVVEVELPKFY